MFLTKEGSKDLRVCLFVSEVGRVPFSQIHTSYPLSIMKKSFFLQPS